MEEFKQEVMQMALCRLLEYLLFFLNKYIPYCKPADKNFLPKLAELRRQFLAAVSIQIMVFVDITPCSLQLGNEISDHSVTYN